MISAILKELIETPTTNWAGMPFSKGRRSLANIENEVYPSAWLYPVPETDELVGSSVNTEYNLLMDVHVVGEVEPGKTTEDTYLDQARLYCYAIEAKIVTDGRLKIVGKIRREPLYNFLGDNLYGFAMKLTVKVITPFGKCYPPI